MSETQRPLLHWKLCQLWDFEMEMCHFVNWGVSLFWFSINKLAKCSNHWIMTDVWIQQEHYISQPNILPEIVNFFQWCVSFFLECTIIRPDEIIICLHDILSRPAI